MLQKSIMAVPNSRMFILSITWILTVMVSCNDGFHFSTIIAATRAKNSGFRLRKFLARPPHFRRSKHLPQPITPVIIEEGTSSTIEPELPLSTNDDGPNDELGLAEKTILQYLSSEKQGTGKFHLYGWRWHTMSLIQETERLCKLAQCFQKKESLSAVDDNQIANLKKSVDYVLDFNLKGMTRVENEVMIPFLRQQFGGHNNGVQQSLDTIIDHLEIEQQKLSKLGLQLSSQISGIDAVDDETMNDIIRKLNEIIVRAKSMLEHKNNIVIPAVTKLVPERRQKSTISKIMSSLGVLDSRLHLVGFHEAIKNNKKELRLWNENIPLVARKVIPMWKQTQYDPRTFALQKM